MVRAFCLYPIGNIREVYYDLGVSLHLADYGGSTEWLNDAVDVWALATPTERDELHKLLWDKRRSYIQNHTPAQRNEDPIWRKMQSEYGDLRGR